LSKQGIAAFIHGACDAVAGAAGSAAAARRTVRMVSRNRYENCKLAGRDGAFLSRQVAARIARPFLITRSMKGMDMKKLLAIALALPGMVIALTAPGVAAEQTRQETVAQRGVEVMPFDLKATTHVFTKTESGGIQRVLAKNPGDARQIRLIHAHLKDIASRFSRGDFSGPAHIHGGAMPGLAELEAARPGEIDVKYRALRDGAEIVYKTGNPALVVALHQWFDAQLSDHGSDAMEGHEHSGMHH
jgi:hypothetical protein